MAQQQNQKEAQDKVFKQFVGQNDHYLKKNPTLMKMIQQMSRKWFEVKTVTNSGGTQKHERAHNKIEK